MGAAPIGNDPIKVTLHPVEQMGALSSFAYDDPYNQGGTSTTAVRVSVVNNYQDKRVQGSVALEVAPGWRVVADRISYHIEPGGAMTRDLVVVSYPVKRGEEWERASGLVKARTEHLGQTYQDVLEIGRPFKLKWRIQRTARGIEAHVRNPHRQRIEGALALITPPAAWPGRFHTLSSVSPRERAFVVEPGAETTLFFAAPNDLGGAWAIARIAYNGHVEYLRAEAVAPVKLAK